MLALAIGAGCQGVSVKRLGQGASIIAAWRVDRVASAASTQGTKFPKRGESKDVMLVKQLETVELAAQNIQALERQSRQPGARELVQARGEYRDALELFLRESSGRRIRLDDAWRDELGARGFKISVRDEGAVWNPQQFDELLVARDFAVNGLDHQYQSEGVGVPLIGVRQFRLDEFTGRKGDKKFLMPRQIYPVTATLREVPASTELREFQLELHDPLLTRTAEFEGVTEPLAADFTTPLAYQFARSPLTILQEIGLLDPRWLEKLQGLYMLHPYEPGRIPVVLVHGLRSSPMAWMKVVNELRGDPVLRERYQIWLFMYPTGVPFPASASHLRGALDELRNEVDPQHVDGALDRMVLVGHSMGGLISKMIVTESGDEIWKLVANKAFDDLHATDEHRALMQRVFFFQPHPSVQRVVFIATPHGGSELGDQFIGRLTDRLIRLPGSLRSTYRVLLAQNGPDFFTPEVRAGLPTSVRELRRDSRLLKTLSRLPVGTGVQFHSIIGRVDDNGPLESSSDGVVPYASSHLDGVASELVVSGDHGCQDSPATIDEIRRILHLHLRQTSTDESGVLTEKLPEPIAISPLPR